MKKILFSVLALAALASCVKEQTLDVASPAAIEFAGTYVENATKTNDPSTTTANITEFSVWGVMDNETGVVLDDELVTLTNGVWTYKNTQYWTPQHTYYFSALAGDRSNNQIVIDLASADDQGMSVDGLGTMTFTNVEGVNDVLYAEANDIETEDVVNTKPEAVKFQFNHLLSKVKFSFTNGFVNDNNTIVVKNIKMVVPNQGTIDLTQTDNGYVWTDLQGETTLVMGDMDAAARVAIGMTASSDNERLTIPAAATQEYEVTFDVELWMGDVMASNASKTVKINGCALEPGKSYNFKATINQDNVDENPLFPIEFEVEVDEWVEVAYEEVSEGVVAGTDGTKVSLHVTSAEGLAYVAEAVAAGEVDKDDTVILEGDIDLANFAITRSAVASNWTPIGTSEKPFTGTFDGNGYTIKNLALVESEAKEGKAYIGFFGYAKDATIKDVTFENVYINIPCLDIDHSQGHIGAVAGSLEGTSTIENVTVKGDIQVYATQEANGASRVAVVAGGNSYGNVTMKNVHVIANEGSYLKANNNTGALAGQLQGKMYFENCSSNIDVTVNKFFAGGLVGIAAGDSEFVNCHTTGDVAVVAGRAGRANDHYRVGGIAGGWADGKKNVCTLTGCTYTGNISGTNADGSVATVFDYDGYVGRGYTLNNCAGSTVIIDGKKYIQAYDNVHGVYFYVGAIVDVNGAKAIIYSVEDGVKAVSVEELNLNGKNFSTATEWAEGLGEGFHLATMEELDEIWTVRKELNEVLASDNAENALFCETDYLQGTTYAVYLSSTLAEGNDPQGNAYFANRVHLKYFNATGYWDYPYSTMSTINTSAPLKSNYFARAVVEL